MTSDSILNELLNRYPLLFPLKDAIGEASGAMISCFEHGNKILICGNGGSSSDSDHIAGELLKGFENRRPLADALKKELSLSDPERGAYLAEKLQSGLPAIALSAHTGLMTAVANDNDPALIYAQQVTAFGLRGDLLIGISTSGSAQNVIDAAITARAKGLTVLGLTGETGGRLKEHCDILVNVPGRRTAWVQELHLPVYHTLCLMVENHFFGTR